jgi:hypothetical protein
LKNDTKNVSFESQLNIVIQIGEKLVELGYYRIESLRMQGIVLSIYALKIHLPSIRDVRCDWIGTGHANFWGNKGAVAIRFFILVKYLLHENCFPSCIENAKSTFQTFCRFLCKGHL